MDIIEHPLSDNRVSRTFASYPLAFEEHHPEKLCNRRRVSDIVAIPSQDIGEITDSSDESETLSRERSEVTHSARFLAVMAYCTFKKSHFHLHSSRHP